MHSSSHFVSDLVSLVLESDDHWWPQDLIRLTQVSYAWLQPTRRLLYATPEIHTFQACSKLARTLSENPTLIHLIKGVELRPLSPDTRHLGANCRGDLKFILGLEGLQTITLGGYLAVKAERFLNIVDDPSSLTRLHIDGTQMLQCSNSFPSLEWDESIAFRFPSLKELRLTNIELEIMFPSLPYQLHLSNLVLENVAITDGYLCHLLHETPSLPRLCIQSGTTYDLGQHVKFVLDSCAVQTLDYEMQTELPLSFPVFDTNTANLFFVRFLHLTGVPIDLGFLSLISQRCPNVEELTIAGRSVTVLPGEWVTFITTRPLSLLRTIGLPWGTNYPPFTGWSDGFEKGIIQTAASHDIRVVAKAHII